MIPSMNLQMPEVRLIGQYFTGLSLSPFLKIGIIFAVLQSFGTDFLARDMLNILERGKGNMSSRFYQ